MSRKLTFAAVAMLAGCAAEPEPRVDPRIVEAAAQHAQLEMERATGVTPRRAAEPAAR